MSRPHLEVDRERCVGTGSCVFAAPEVFSQSEVDGRVVVRDNHPGEDQREAVEEAVDVCPVAAILLRGAAESEGARP
ncbi:MULTISPECIES: ferredoxin [unclassified Amycolatopsis]|uniref:ferredoxin n=1 Tax=unclassified Amycolatopsis TaxID=2618356 RepID=UPI001F182DE3|nr:MULTISPECIES: ferredoxin [unclassified Amycolatopsis]